jgi:hypothetical protein
MDDPLRPARAELFGKKGEPDPTAVELAPENEDAARVYMMARNQVVSTGMGVADISIPAVKIVMELLGVKAQLACLNRVRWLFHHFLERRADEGRGLEPGEV